MSQVRQKAASGPSVKPVPVKRRQEPEVKPDKRVRTAPPAEQLDESTRQFLFAISGEASELSSSKLKAPLSSLSAKKREPDVVVFEDPTSKSRERHNQDCVFLLFLFFSFCFFRCC
eukprot:m.150941 g.150941  ORF g.150941 m.150941 type:complete len:116 (-) comp52811_c0_seq20:610-957(-)